MGKRVGVTQAKLNKAAREAFGRGAYAYTYVPTIHLPRARRASTNVVISVPNKSEGEARELALYMLERMKGVAGGAA